LKIGKTLDSVLDNEYHNIADSPFYHQLASIMDKPQVDDSLIPEDMEEDPDYIIAFVQVADFRAVTALVATDSDKILVEATGQVLYEAYENGTLVSCEDVRMMAVPFDKFSEYTICSPDLESEEERRQVKQDLDDVREQLLDARDNMQDPMKN